MDMSFRDRIFWKEEKIVCSISSDTNIMYKEEVLL